MKTLVSSSKGQNLISKKYLMQSGSRCVSMHLPRIDCLYKTSAIRQLWLFFIVREDSRVLAVWHCRPTVSESGGLETYKLTTVIKFKRGSV